MRAIEVALRGLSDHGIKHIFGIPAGSINALYDALLDLPELQPIIVKHETTAGYMASAYTRITGTPAVCVGSSGPGATNLVTPAANAWKEKLPVIFITGSVPSSKIGRGGAQELDAVPIFASVTKLSRVVMDANELPTAMAEALFIAQTGVPGPVHLAIPIDIQMTDIGTGTSLFPVVPPVQPILPASDPIQAATRLLLDAGPKCAMLLGYGAKSAGRVIRQLAEAAGWMVATTPRGKGAFPEDHPLSLGVYGLSGHHKAVEYLNSNEPEVLLVIGSSLGELATGNWSEQLVQGKKLIHIDYDPAEFNKSYASELNIVGDILLIVEQFLSAFKVNTDKLLYLEEVAAASYDPSGPAWNTQNAIRKIGELAPDNVRYYIDIGEFMTYSIQNLCMKEQQDFDIDINFGAMGSGIGGSLGAQLAEPDRPIICITGDGCFFMHGFEVLTAHNYGLPILFFVINNARLGMVHHGHMLQYNRCLESFSQPRLAISEISRACGIRYAQVTCHEELSAELIQEWRLHMQTMVIEIVVEGNEIPPMGERVKFLQGATY